jgi:SNF family Na+-dependent transporter
MGQFFMILFFVALAFAAFTSMIAQVEVTTRAFVDAGMERKKGHKDYFYQRIYIGSAVSHLDAGPGKSGLGLGSGLNAGRIVLRHLHNPLWG